jgi:hypothetical protein
VADEPGHTRRVPDDVPRVVGHHHLDEHVAREDLLLDRPPLAVLDLDLLLGGDHHLEDLVLDAHRLDAVLEVGLDLVLIAGVGVNDVPLLVVDRPELAIATINGGPIDGNILLVRDRVSTLSRHRVWSSAPCYCPVRALAWRIRDCWG